MKLRLVTAPDPVLNTRAKEVEKVDDSIRAIMDEMVDLMYESRGIGLAANQAGLLQRVIVLDLQDEDSQYDSLFPLKMANPVIIDQSAECSEEKEGCLSLPEQVISLKRPTKITVEYLDYNNKKQTITADGWFARAIQHEIDHIDGKLLINYVSHLKKTMILKKLTKFKKHYA